MKVILTALLCVFIFTGCYNKQPKIEIVKEYETKLILPDASNYEYFKTPTLPDNLISLPKEEIINILLPYAIRLQTSVLLYESRTKSLIEWRDNVTEIYKKKD